MQISIVDFKNINLNDRIDAEYFEPSYLKIEEKLKKLNTKPLSSYCKITSSAFYPAATQLYEIGEVPFIRCVDSIHFPVITTLQNLTFKRLPEFFINKNKNIKVLENEDIVITKVGTPCYASIVKGFDRVALSRTVLGLYNIKDIDPYYLVVFLRSRHGFDQLMRERELTIQYQLTLMRVGRIFVYKPKNNNFEKLIGAIFRESQYHTDLSFNLYKEAEAILLKELNLSKWKPKIKLHFVKNFSDTVKEERFDADFFQPKYDEIIESIKNYEGGYDLLGNLAKIKKSVEVGSKSYQEDGIPFVRVSNLTMLSITSDNLIYISEEIYNKLKKHQPKKNEILLSKDATPGIAFHLKEEPEKMILSGGILRLKLNDDRISEECLTLILNSILVQQQVEKDAGGSIIEHWRLDQVKNTIIPILTDDIKKNIDDKVTKSFLMKYKSVSLFEIAKKGVELAIEQDEKKAKEWVEKKINKLGVNLYD